MHYPGQNLAKQMPPLGTFKMLHIPPRMPMMVHMSWRGWGGQRLTVGRTELGKTTVDGGSHRLGATLSKGPLAEAFLKKLFILIGG